jgi:alcohol dehydrogenase (cytochrome c)
MAPLVYDHKVYIGSSGGEYGIRGSFTAYSESGKRLWRWYVVSKGWEGKYVSEVHGLSLHRDIAREKADAPKHADAWRHGGGPIWQTPAVDPTTHTIFLATGNPAPQLIGAVRPGDNLYTDSIVALDAENGKMRWYYQETPHDIWDYDATSPAVLLTARDANGDEVPAVGEAGKTGWFYVLDRRDGHFIRVSEPFVPQRHMYEPPKPSGSYMEPGALGGANWPPVAYNPSLHLVYVSAIVQPRFDKPKPYVPWKPGGERWAGSREVPHTKSKGTFSAIDVDTGRLVWQHKLDLGLMDGALATPDLTFVGVPTDEFVAYDAKTGKRLWRFHTDAGVSGPPVAYMIDGREYIAVVAGGNALIGDKPGDSVYAFALPKSGG